MDSKNNKNNKNSKNNRNLRGVLVLLAWAVVLTIGFYAGAPALLRLFGASDATLPYALAYSRLCRKRSQQGHQL